MINTYVLCILLSLIIFINVGDVVHLLHCIHMWEIISMISYSVVICAGSGVDSALYISMCGIHSGFHTLWEIHSGSPTVWEIHSGSPTVYGIMGRSNTLCGIHVGSPTVYGIQPPCGGSTLDPLHVVGSWIRSRIFM